MGRPSASDSMQPATHLFDSAPNGRAQRARDLMSRNSMMPTARHEGAGCAAIRCRHYSGHLVLYQTGDFGSMLGQFHTSDARFPRARFAECHNFIPRSYSLPILFVPQTVPRRRTLPRSGRRTTFRELGVIIRMIDTAPRSPRTDARPLRADSSMPYRSPSAARTKARNHEPAPKPNSGGSDRHIDGSALHTPSMFLRVRADELDLEDRRGCGGRHRPPSRAHHSE